MHVCFWRNYFAIRDLFMPGPFSEIWWWTMAWEECFDDADWQAAIVGSWLQRWFFCLCNIVLLVQLIFVGLLRLLFCVSNLYSYCQRGFFKQGAQRLRAFTQLLTLMSNHQITVVIVTSLRKFTQFHEKVSPTLRNCALGTYLNFS